MQFFAVFYLLMSISFGMPITDQVRQWMVSKVGYMTEEFESLSSLVSGSIELRAAAEDLTGEDRQDFIDKQLDELDHRIDRMAKYYS